MYKILLVEDEAGIRNTVLKCFDWDSLDCTAVGAASGLDALNMCLRSTPDIVITDIVMPGIDGITLVRYLKHEFPDIRFIIITSHREFDYAKESLDMGVQAFLLKPIDENELRSNIIKAIESIQAEQNHVNQNSAAEIREKYLANILRGYMPDANTFQLAPKSPLLRHNAYVTAVMKFDDHQDVSAMNQHRVYNYLQTINNIEEIPCARVGEHIVILYPLREENNLWKKKADSFFVSIVKLIQDTLRFSVSAGVSSIQHGIHEAKQGYLNAMQAVQYQFFAGKGSVIHYEDISGTELSTSKGYVACDYIRSLEDALHNGSLNALKQVIDDFFDHVQQNNRSNIDRCRSEIFCILLLCFARLTGNNNAAQATILTKYAFFQSILSSETLMDIKDLFTSILIDLKDYHSIKAISNKRDIVDKILEYLEAHYSETITLSDMAHQVYLSPAYVSTLISSETGKTFIDILNGIRVQKAINLMKNTNLKYYSIAEQVGFKDGQYFSIVFKKHTGMSPTEYKQFYFPNS